MNNAYEHLVNFGYETEIFNFSIRIEILFLNSRKCKENGNDVKSQQVIHVLSLILGFDTSSFNCFSSDHDIHVS